MIIDWERRGKRGEEKREGSEEEMKRKFHLKRRLRAKDRRGT